MLSAVLTSTLLSIFVGFIVGLADALGFIPVVKYVFGKVSNKIRMIAISAEIFRLVVLIAIVAFIIIRTDLLSFPLIITAMGVSLVAKTLITFGLRYSH